MQEVRGVADAKATEIYAAAYDKSVDTRDFYEFMMTMKAYKTTLDAESSLVLSTGSDFYKYLKAGDGK